MDWDDFEKRKTSLRPGQNFWGKDTIQQKASEWEVEILCGYLADSLVAVSQPWIGRISGSRPGWKNKGESAALTHRHSFISPLLWVTACDSVSLPVPLSALSSFSQPICCSLRSAVTTVILVFMFLVIPGKRSVWLNCRTHISSL